MKGKGGIPTTTLTSPQAKRRLSSLLKQETRIKWTKTITGSDMPSALGQVDVDQPTFRFSYLSRYGCFCASDMPFHSSPNILITSVADF